MRVSMLLIVLAALTALLFSSVSAADMSKYNSRIGKKFLEENAKKDGVITTSTGLQYKVIEAGKGTVHPSKDSQVKVHYEGTLVNGEVFDSSIARNDPATFGVGQVIPGWTEALQLMVEGDKWEVYIPSELGYGASGAGGKIGPNSALVFKVELIEIQGGGKKPTKAKASKTEKPTLEEL